MIKTIQNIHARLKYMLVARLATSSNQTERQFVTENALPIAVGHINAIVARTPLHVPSSASSVDLFVQ
ncbi:hypothetical protein FRC14_003406 [Serendipita sp. 396]|nr:hypothetical protein FRC14_003406 [Serendipita sp. 396]KAG8799365.1 hypothetical protein FRC16_005270 [Serendipita sp. 398]KAG8836418.1 hypothetical protein FRC18_011415 [Serendipita sp. 400]KAG8857083.1 hypothetical protein FRB91_011878 [Serendipita sp. 411]KAG9054768.1 hypothetical protein FS842_004208 [Serendipita sp. 407]